MPRAAILIISSLYTTLYKARGNTDKIDEIIEVLTEEDIILVIQQENFEDWLV